MTISDDIKKLIEQEYKSWEDSQYGVYKDDKEHRKKFGMFYTPPELSIKMLEKFDSVADKTILDPTIGAGGLIAAAVIAGADPRRCYGIELDEKIVEIARRRLVLLGVPPTHIVQGDALTSAYYDNFEDDHEELKNFAAVEKLDNGSIRIVVALHGKEVKEKTFGIKTEANEVLAKLKKNNVKILKI